MPDNPPASKINPTSPSRVSRAVHYEEISGPIPSPQILQQYNNIIPDAAERILRMAEKQSDHRISIESKIVNSNILKSYLGIILATVIVPYGLYIAKEIAIKGNPATAALIAALDIGGLIAIALTNARQQRREREQRRETASAPPQKS